MGKKRNDFRRGRRALLVMLWLSAGLLKCPGDETNTCPDLLPAEQFVTNHLTNQEFIDLSDNTNSSAVTNSSTVINRTVRGKFLEWLLTKNVAQLPHDGLRLKNALIAGPVDLRDLEVPVPVRLACCHFQANVNLCGAHFDHDLSFVGCLFDGEFQASALRVDGSLELKIYDLTNTWKISSSETPPGEASLTNYLGTNETIRSWSPGHGEFTLDENSAVRSWLIEDARTNMTHDATNRWTNYFDATIRGDDLFIVQRYDDVAAQASNSVMNLTVGPLTGQWQKEPESGLLDLNYVGTNLAASPCKNLVFIGTDVFTSGATNRPTTVRWLFDNANDPASLPLAALWDAGSLTNPTDQTVTFFEPTVFRKGASLDQAVISGKLDAGGVEFRQGLYAQSLKVGDDIVMTGARFDADANFVYAQIGHDFALQESLFDTNFNSYGMSVGGSLMVDHARFRAGASFEAVSAGKAFRGQYVRFENRSALAEFRGLKVDGEVDFLRAQFAGPANFILSQIKGNFQAQGATFEDDHTFLELKNLPGLNDDTYTFNTDFGSMAVDGFAIFENVLFARSVSFRNARFGNLYLDGVRWPEQNFLTNYIDDPKTNDLLRLEGMSFTTIRDITSDHFLHTRAQLEESQKNLLAMFTSRSPYSFDIYAQLESFFQREGAPDLADEVFINAKEREGKEATGLAKLANTLLDWTVGYGRKPWKAFIESLACILICAAFCKGCMVKKISPVQPPSWPLAFFFSLGAFLPFIELGTKELLDFRKKREWFCYLIAVEKILGYILVPLWTLALSGLLR